MMMTSQEDKDLLVLLRIMNSRKENKPMPSYRELAKDIGVSVGGVYKRIQSLIDRGFLYPAQRRSRALRITQEGIEELRRGGLV